MIDHDGEPILPVAPDHPAVSAARSGRLTRLDVPTHPTLRIWVCLTGRLALPNPHLLAQYASPWLAQLARNSIEDGAVLLTLRVAGVSVGCAHAVTAGKAVDLDAYAAAHPDPITAHAQRIIDHLNHDHPRALLAAAATVGGRDPKTLIAAQLTGLDHTGADLDVLDLDGATPLRLTFSRAATDIDTLITALRIQLRTAH